MRLESVHHIAINLGIRPGDPAKVVDLVRAIQQKEGNFACFATATEGRCDQYRCRWRNDCFAIAQQRKNKIQSQ
ncbi:MAG TPA: SAP domain-containing protein [Gammaproteobacteria bacterium]|nr:SAP domain-containing protein [Gammaproteobacteria bacterium]